MARTNGGDAPKRPGGTAPNTPDQRWPYAEARQQLADTVAREVAATAEELGFDRLDDDVRAALERVPRHLFVPEALRADAYANRPLPIGHGQTISQPYIVAITTQLCRPGPDSRVLEIGTGCGYQAAMLAELAGDVISIEAVPELADTARTRLADLGYDNIRVMTADGSSGLPAEAPFDAIAVTAAAPEDVRDALAKQLAPRGRLVVPVELATRQGLLGLQGAQTLCQVIKDADGRVHTRSVLPVAFVPLVGGTSTG
ncbi:protein-L-isoaspartate(D-aspartate) O-methyltransferase [Rhodovibrio salinarum]|uniref:Protein-L-isoaspartate O-methyltransferase n=1 Tax=Rhodovibrio salinarum TaxID=1087 RepID=A0A934QI23_9PROT|nr:protein-L-isoaspartate(D-aspartate) O-methyltransferase [Rhodovibrio salinarum]MBK1696935.1 protein-L-isoaspartate(D-aspartate) O-methyltransferase [Rhodovibrio salinarum]